LANPATPVSPFLRSGAAKKTASTTSPFLRDNKQAAVDNSPLAAILNFGQGVINTISTPMYGIQGFLNQAGKEAQKGNANPIDALWKSIEAGNKNATSWTRGEKTVMGEELLKNLGILKDDDFGDVKIGDITINLPGLAADIALDPLTYVPGGVFITAAKAPVIAGRTAIKAGQLAKTGQLATSVAKRAATTKPLQDVVAAAPAGATIPLKASKGLRDARRVEPRKLELAKSVEKIAAEQGRALTKLEKTQIKQANLVAKTNPDLVAYKTVQLGNSPLNTVNNQLLSALEAGRLAMMNTILSDTAKRSLQKTNRKEARLINRGEESGITFSAVIGTARQAENVEVKAGETALPLTDGSVQAVKENTLFTDGDKTHIWDGKNVWTWDKGDAATNARLAQEWLDAKEVKPAAQIIGAPIVDSAPSVKVLKQISKAKGKTDEVKTINKMLNNLDKIAKTAKGASVTGDNVAYRVNEILSSGNPTKAKFWRELSTPTRNAVEEAIAGGSNNVFKLIERGFATQSKELKSAIKEINSIVVIGKEGQKATIGQLFESYAKGGKKYSELSADTKAQMIQGISDMLNGTSLAVKQAELNALVGPETAAKIIETGVMDTTAGRPFKKGVLTEILNGIKAAPKVAEKSYEDFDDLLVGLKREDQIDTTVLTKILNAIDPENELIKQVDKIADADLNAQMAAVISRKGPQTVTYSRRRLELLDSSRILKASGLSQSEAVSAYIETRLAGKMPPLANAAGQSRQAAITKVLADFNDVDGKEAIDDSLLSLGTAIDARMGYLFSIMETDGAKVFISSLDDAAMRSTTEAYAIGAKVATYQQTNSNFMTALIGSHLGISTKRATNSAKSKGANYKPRSGEEKAKRLARQLETDEDVMLAITGSRFVTSKTAAQAIEDGLGKHYAYIHLGDFITVLDDAKQIDLVVRALFPQTAKKTDSFSYYALTEATRKVMEARDLGKAPNRADIVKTLLSRGQAVKNSEGKIVQKAQEPWSPEFKATTKQTAEDIADVLLREDIAQKFTDIHTAKAIAGVEDSLGEVITLTQDVVQSLLDGFRANKRSGNMADASRTQLAREAFAKFSYATGFMEGRGGQEAADLMKIASTMFLRDGRMANIREVKDFVGDKMLPDEQGQMDEMIAMIDLMYKTDNPHLTAAEGFEELGAPKQASIDKAQTALDKAEIEYNVHMKNWSAEAATEAGAKAWATKHTSLTKKLDTARNNAEKVGIEPRYWDMLKFDQNIDNPWVPKSAYNHAEAIKQAAKAEGRFALVGGKQLDRGKALVDTAPVDKPRKMTKPQREKILAEWNEAARLRAMELSDGASEDAAQHAMDILPDLEAAGMDPYSAAIRAEQERIAYKYAQIEQRVDVVDPESVAKMERSTVQYSTTYGRAREARRAGLEQQGALRTFAQKWNANSNESISLLRNATAQGFNAKNKISKVVRDLGDMLDGIDATPFARQDDKFDTAFEAKVALRGRLFSTAWNAARSTKPITQEYGPQFEAIVKLTKSVIDAAKLQLRGLDMDLTVIDRYFKKYGINDFEGFKMPGEYSTPKAFINKFFDDLPYNENTKPAGSDSFKLFADRKDKFEASGNDPYLMFSNIISAMIDAKTEQVFVHDFVSQFGYKADGLTLKTALDKGRVPVKGIPSNTGFDLSVHLIGMENKGALFDPEIAKLFGGLNREWSQLQEAKMGPILRYLMDFTGILKTTQTTLRAGHVMTNVLGDGGAAVIGGARSFKVWYNAIKYSKQFMQQSIKADGFLYMKGDTEEALNLAVGQLTRLSADPAKEIAEATKGGYPAVVGGKKIILDDAFVLNDLLGDTATQTDNIINNDIQGLLEATQARFGEGGVRGSQAKSLYAKVKLAFDSAVKPAGDVTAYYSNISRTATALQVISSKNWSSIAEMKKAIADKVHLYHPSIYSLTATERQYPRAIFTYYTWLRVAHNALIDMTLNHTAAMMLYPKVQANAAAQANYEPMSIGDPWGVNKQSTPQYMNFSTYAPVGVEGPRGAMIMKPSFLPFDVLDTWNWTYNPYRSWDENIGGTIAQTGRILGRSTNIVAQPGIEFLTGTDMNTGKALQNRNLETFGDEVISNIGYGGLLKGLGVYTPANKRPENTSNPITDRDRELYLQNWLFGLKRQDTQTVSNQQNTRNDQNQYMNDFMEWYNKQERDNQ
jgi:hypothetical protein